MRTGEFEIHSLVNLRELYCTSQHQIYPIIMRVQGINPIWETIWLSKPASSEWQICLQRNSWKLAIVTYFLGFLFVLWSQSNCLLKIKTWLLTFYSWLEAEEREIRSLSSKCFPLFPFLWTYFPGRWRWASWWNNPHLFSRFGQVCKFSGFYFRLSYTVLWRLITITWGPFHIVGFYRRYL